MFGAPNPKGDRPESVKRRELKKELTDAGYLALYSEETTVDYRLAPLNLQELMQLREKPLVVCIAGSPGPIAEAETLASSKPNFCSGSPMPGKRDIRHKDWQGFCGPWEDSQSSILKMYLGLLRRGYRHALVAEDWRNAAMVIEEQRRQFAEIAPARG